MNKPASDNDERVSNPTTAPASKRSLGRHLLILVFVFLLTELSLRTFFPQISSQAFNRELFIANRYRQSYGLMPSAAGKAYGVLLHNDSLGFRKSGKPFNKKKRSRLLLGDSVGFGPGVKDEQNFSSIVSNSIDSQNVMNLSVIGYGSADYLNVLKTLLIDEQNRFGIEKISLCFSLADISQNSFHGEAPSNPIRHALQYSLNYFKSECRVYLFAKRFLKNSAKSSYQRHATFYNNDSLAFRNMLADFREMDSICQQVSVEFELFELPHLYYLQKGKEVAYCTDILHTALAEQQIPSYRLEMGSRDELNNRNGRDFFLFGDCYHYSPLGHQKVAEQILNVASTN